MVVATVATYSAVSMSARTLLVVLGSRRPYSVFHIYVDGKYCVITSEASWSSAASSQASFNSWGGVFFTGHGFWKGCLIGSCVGAVPLGRVFFCTQPRYRVLCVYVCVCVCMCVFVHMCMCVFVFVWACVCLCAYVYVHFVCGCERVCVCVFIVRRALNPVTQSTTTKVEPIYPIKN